MVAGIFFFGYFLFEIPSNLMLHKIGARIWIACTECTNPSAVAKNSPVIRMHANPDSRPDLVQHQVLGISNRKYPKKKNSRYPSKLLAGNCQFLVHRQRRKLMFVRSRKE